MPVLRACNPAADRQYLAISGLVPPPMICEAPEGWLHNRVDGFEDCTVSIALRLDVSGQVCKAMLCYPLGSL